MSTLSEIEEAVKSLTTAELERRLRELRHARPATEASQNLNARFAGVISLRQDPLDWQRQVRAVVTT
ncbi:MAG: hypothetical protein H0V56_09525 [Chthoniobacterales bacterium]|nr:hypothetical protein [Chthoniobacterales bacterium]